MKFAIAGAGAMGSRFGVMLQESGQEVVLIDNWEAHIKAIQTNGLQIHTDEGIKTYQFSAYLTSDVPKQHFDCIILFTKAMQMNQMLSDIEHLIDRDTYILVLANGIGNVETVERYVDPAHIIVGVTTWSSELNGPGDVTLTGEGYVTLQFASSKCRNPKFLNQLVVDMNHSGLDVKISDDVIASIWKKAAFNSILNTLMSLIGCNVAQFGRLTNRDKLIEVVLKEIEAVAQKLQIQFDAEDVKKLIQMQFTEDGNAEHYPSMYQDLSKKRLTEVEYLNGYIARKGKEMGVPTPVNSMLTMLIHCKEELNRM